MIMIIILMLLLPHTLAILLIRPLPLRALQVTIAVAMFSIQFEVPRTLFLTHAVTLVFAKDELLRAPSLLAFTLAVVSV
jgi:hypothetical protein